MGFSKSRTLYLVACLALVALALRPGSAIETFVDRVFAVSRFVGELARPVAWISRSAVLAADAHVEHALADETTLVRALLVAAERAALPVDPALARGRGLVVAQVVARSVRTPDRLWVRASPGAQVPLGAPVVMGDQYVGCVREKVRAVPGEYLVELVTAGDFRVGARLSAANAGESIQDARCVVGGLAPNPGGEAAGLCLSVLYPSDRSFTNGVARVFDTATSMGALADGFVIGDLTQSSARGLDILAVRPRVDLAHGLDRLTIVVPPEHGPAGSVLAQDPFDTSAWIEARILMPCSPSARRRARILDRGEGANVRSRAAVGSGARFVGRVERVSRWSSTVRVLGDPGLAFEALARIPGRDAPVALGKLVCLGWDDARSVRFHWDALVPLATRATALITTSSGERDVPPGLLVGKADLPAGRGPFEILVTIEPSTLDLVHVRVFRGPHRDAEEER